MKTTNKNIEDIFASSRFEVVDNGFSKGVMDKIYAMSPSEAAVIRFDTVIDLGQKAYDKSITRLVFGRVAAVVAICALVCSYVFSNINYENLANSIVAKSENFENKTLQFSEKLTDKLINKQ